MAKFHCFSAILVGKKKKSKGSPKAVDDGKGSKNGTLQVKLENLINLSNEKAVKITSFDVLLPFGAQGRETSDVKVAGDNNLVGAEGAYEGGDEHDEISSMRRDFSDFDLQANSAGQGDSGSVDAGVNEKNSPENKSERYVGVVTTEMTIQSGHVSDPGIGQSTAVWGSPRLKRSCSNIETRVANRLPASPSKSRSYDDLQNLSGNVRGEVSHGIHGSPLSMMTPCSADRVMLKRRSSSQVLPSRSRKLWWKLFLWSHRNLHKPWASKPRMPVSFNDVNNPKGGYSSDTLEPSHVLIMRNQKGKEEDKNNNNRTDMWPQNQWVAFSAESSSLNRVDAWVNSLEDNAVGLIDDGDDYDEQSTQSIVFPNSPEIGESSGKNNYSQTSRRLVEEVLQANNIIQSLNSLSSVAHISGMGLKVIPTISAFSSLRAVNLSSNLIVHITPGTLPKSLHTLDLSRNKIASIEGLRELTRLRVLNLSYNRISRVGHGLSNCTLIKELYLAGNKIGNVEGLHRLLKLSVLDLSFNKITTAKALGQLVANYHSLLALNLLGNPIQSNIGEDQLLKAVSGLLPQLTYLNKQPIKPQRVREAATDSVAKAALGNSGWSSRRRLARRASQGSSASSIRGRVGDSAGHKGQGGGNVQRSSWHRSKGKSSLSGRK